MVVANLQLNAWFIFKKKKKDYDKGDDNSVN